MILSAVYSGASQAWYREHTPKTENRPYIKWKSSSSGGTCQNLIHVWREWLYHPSIYLGTTNLSDFFFFFIQSLLAAIATSSDHCVLSAGKATRAPLLLHWQKTIALWEAFPHQHWLWWWENHNFSFLPPEVEGKKSESSMGGFSSPQCLGLLQK